MDQSGLSDSDVDRASGSSPGDQEEQPGTQASVKCGSVISPLLHTCAQSVSLQTPASTDTPGTEGTEGTHGDVPRETSDECPVCTEPFQKQGDHAAAILHCNHPVCQRCLQAVQRLSRDPSRLRCPLCRQTTPLPQWDMFILQEDMYSGGVDICQGGRVEAGTDLGPWSRYRLMRIHSLYLYVSVLVLLLLMLGYLLSRDK
ncbi:hypothetical protein NL108_017628 [Boleophthalmus pectinirostris]|uniref:E3 ubiquitin-protein ligase TRIM33-like n=1 Tax=Boleophthalmus pectinirostris TaxID=150288 RepID=UPI000A1C621C|nr:E3 ubiquitin-protein ligase TRIM33-like [Boleophthalmus pectinirostris]KAJ0057765.1 hypothetical protein NL108_017628 [Boleophthalmus pectinirostris]